MENRSEGKTQIAERFRIGLIALFLLLFTASCGRGGGIGDPFRKRRPDMDSGIPAH